MAKLPNTPRSRVRTVLRRMFLQSRERHAALKREEYSCEKCGIKQSKAKGKEVKVEVHHRNGIDWEEIVDSMYDKLLCPPANLEVLCRGCHDKKHKREKR